MPKQEEKDNDRQRYAEQPQQYSSAHHILLKLLLSASGNELADSGFRSTILASIHAISGSIAAQSSIAHAADAPHRRYPDGLEQAEMDVANNVLGMLIGATLDREDGDSGVKGAIKGYAVEGALKIVIPLAVTFAIGWGVQYALRRGLSAMSSGLEAQRRRQAAAA